MHDVDAGDFVEERSGEMRASAVSAGCKVQLARLRLRERDHLDLYREPGGGTARCGGERSDIIGRFAEIDDSHFNLPAGDSIMTIQFTPMPAGCLDTGRGSPVDASIAYTMRHPDSSPATSRSRPDGVIRIARGVSSVGIQPIRCSFPES